MMPGKETGHLPTSSRRTEWKRGVALSLKFNTFEHQRLLRFREDFPKIITIDAA